LELKTEKKYKIKMKTQRRDGKNVRASAILFETYTEDNRINNKLHESLVHSFYEILIVNLLYLNAY
jgi:hypothetical protein